MIKFKILFFFSIKYRLTYLLSLSSDSAFIYKIILLKDLKKKSCYLIYQINN